MIIDKSDYNRIFIKQEFELIEINGDKFFKSLGNKNAVVIQKESERLLDCNPDNFYDPWQHLQDSKNNGKIKPPYVEFANLPYNEMELLKYANNRGIPSSLTAIQEYGLQDVVSLEDQNGLYRLDDFQQDILKMKTILLLRYLLTMPDNEFKTSPLLSEHIDLCDFYLGKKVSRNLKEELIHTGSKWLMKIALQDGINKELQGISPTVFISQTGSSFESILLYKNFKQALYATLVDDITTPSAICADIKCRKSFTVDHKGKIYCSKKCGLRVAQQEYQDRHRVNGGSDYGKEKQQN